MHNAPHISYLQALTVRCAVLPSLRPLPACSVLSAPSSLYLTKMWVWIWAMSPAKWVASGTVDKGAPCHYINHTS
jgi:hypothetical protein